LIKDQNFKTDRATVLDPATTQETQSSPRLIIVSGVLLGHQIELGEAPVTIGRSSECTIALPHPSVSRQHCRIWRENGRYRIEDLGSTNRTFLNGEAVTRADLRDGDQISVGSNALKFFIGASVVVLWRLRNRPGDEARAAQSYSAAVAYPDAPADAWRWHGIALMKQGRAGEAKAAFARYLLMKPDAPDAAWVRQMAG